MCGNDLLFISRFGVRVVAMQLKEEKAWMEAAILRAVDNTKRYETEIRALQDKVNGELNSDR